MMIKKLSAITMFGAIAAMFSVGSALATPVHTFTGTPDDMAGKYTFEQKYTVGAASIAIDKLGIYDYLGNGLAESHLMGLFDNSGNLIYSTTIAAGTGSTLAYGFRWIDIASTTFAAGSTFSLVTQSNLDAHNMVPGYTLNPQVTSLEGGYVSGAVFNPNLISTSKDNIIWSGNFNIADTKVPEPASLGLMGLGLAALAFRPKKAKAA